MNRREWKVVGILIINMERINIEKDHLNHLADNVGNTMVSFNT